MMISVPHKLYNGVIITDKINNFLYYEDELFFYIKGACYSLEDIFDYRISLI